MLSKKWQAQTCKALYLIKNNHIRYGIPVQLLFSNCCPLQSRSLRDRISRHGGAQSFCIDKCLRTILNHRTIGDSTHHGRFLEFFNATSLLPACPPLNHCFYERARQSEMTILSELPYTAFHKYSHAVRLM